MGKYTYYLTVRNETPARFRVGIEPRSPLEAIRDALEHSTDLRYSPILPAYLTPNEEPSAPPATPNSVAFFFASKPYQALGKLRPGLSQAERDVVFFTEGLASVLLLNCDPSRAQEIKAEIGCPQMEFWTIHDGALEHSGIDLFQDSQQLDGMPFSLSATDDSEIDVYVEQISASVASLWASYGVHFAEERGTLTRVLELAHRLIEHHTRLRNGTQSMETLRQRNAIISALVELSASLSYSVTQGTSGVSPLLANRSPFPHHSLLGVGGAVRALTKFTRYLEGAFQTRSAAAIIEKQYATKKVPVPARISTYDSGKAYEFKEPHEELEEEEFDLGGDFPVVNNLPLLANFSLRHGFKEAKFSVTAASESLTAECLPAWTLMTLSHEIMHSRVRDIFQALFGTTWQDDAASDRWDVFYKEFAIWYDLPAGTAVPLDQGIRNAVLNYCCAAERATIIAERRSETDREISRDDLLVYFRKHRRLAAELFVHFHDYYFAYARQPQLYVMSLWASWTTVAAPVARPAEYLVRTLATIACGTGAQSRAAFNDAASLLLEGLDSLEAGGVRSALFDELRSLLENEAREKTFALFKPAYYLIDQVRLNFASRTIARKIDRLETDPFAEGSTVASDYSASIYVYGEQDPEKVVSPIRHSLAALVRRLSGDPPINDLQWLTAWNTLVISSQEVGPC